MEEVTHKHTHTKGFQRGREKDINIILRLMWDVTVVASNTHTHTERDDVKEGFE